MDPLMLLTSFVSTVTIIGFVYSLLQRFKMEDIDDHICRLETKINKFEKRLDTRVNKLEERLDSKMIKLEERRFWLATNKKLEDEILEERIKSSKNV
jgi:CHASE1-domain containing sensor protein